MKNADDIKQEVRDVRKNYTRTANILFESYEDLRPQEKWLYINLVYLCGAKGTRYLSLRYISEKTGISTGALSGSTKPEKNDPGMIRRLHNAGLVHAEKKHMVRKDGKKYGQEQYHITIVDIWQLNEIHFAQKRSDFEHIQEEDPKSVQISNASVQNSNALAQKCSDFERKCSDSDTNIILHNKITESNKTTRQESNTVVANATRYTHPFHSFLSFDDLMKPTIMIISLTSKQFESEMEDDRRHRIAGEIEHELVAKGFPVQVQTVHDSDDIVDAQVSTLSSTPLPEKAPSVPPVSEVDKPGPNVRKMNVRTNKSTSKETSGKTTPAAEKEPPTLPEELANASETEKDVYTRLLTEKDRKKYLTWSPGQRTVYLNFLGVMGHAVPVAITPAIETSVRQLEKAQPTTEDFKAEQKFVLAQDRQKDKQFYKGRGMKLWDYAREFADWKQYQMTLEAQESAPQPLKPKTTRVDDYHLTGEDLWNLKA